MKSEIVELQALLDDNMLSSLCVSFDDGSELLFYIDSSFHNKDEDDNNSCVIQPSCGSGGSLVSLMGYFFGGRHNREEWTF